MSANEAQRSLVDRDAGVATTSSPTSARLALLGYDPARGLTLLADRRRAAAGPRRRAARSMAAAPRGSSCCLGGASHAALSAFAGEREAGTLETLLVQPVPSTAIVLAKFAAVLAVRRDDARPQRAAA
jgi:hypothetical protein